MDTLLRYLDSLDSREGSLGGVQQQLPALTIEGDDSVGRNSIPELAIEAAIIVLNPDQTIGVGIDLNLLPAKRPVRRQKSSVLQARDREAEHRALQGVVHVSTTANQRVVHSNSQQTGHCFAQTFPLQC